MRVQVCPFSFNQLSRFHTLILFADDEEESLRNLSLYPKMQPQLNGLSNGIANGHSSTEESEK